MKQYFNFEEIFSFAWTKTKQHAWFLVCMAMIYAVIMSAVDRTMGLEEITALLVALSLLSMSLIIVRNESFSFSDIFNRLRSPKLVLNFLALTVIYIAAICIFVMPFIAAFMLTVNTAMTNGGFSAVPSKLIVVILTTLVLLLPGIYVSVRFKFYPYVLLENEHLNIVDVIKHTEKLTRGHFWQLFIFFIMLAVLNILGALAFMVGLFLTIPVSVLAVAHVYRKLQGHAH